MPYAPPDMVIMAGMQEQRVYVIPSRDLVVVRMGFPGSKEVSNDMHPRLERQGRRTT